MLNCKSCSSSAAVVDGKLILSFTEALTPVVWQMDLAEARSSALEVIEDNNAHKLKLKTSKGETVEVAAFPSKEDAVKALKIVAKALASAHGQIRNDSSNGGHTQPIKKQKRAWLKILSIFLAIFIAFNIWVALQSPGPNTNVTSAPSNDESQAGVPLNADEFLRQ